MQIADVDNGLTRTVPLADEPIGQAADRQASQRLEAP